MKLPPSPLPSLSHKPLADNNSASDSLTTERICQVCEKRVVLIGDTCGTCMNESTRMTKQIVGRSMGLTLGVDRTARKPL